MNLPPPMTTRRVQEAITSTSDHIGFARDLTAAIKPISLVKPQVVPAVVVPVPRLVSIEVSGTTCKVRGKHLKNVDVFRLDPVKPSTGGSLNAINFSFHTDIYFEATLPSAPPEAAYLAWAIDDQKRGDVLFLEIEAAGPGPAPLGNASCAVAAIVPNAVIVICDDHGAPVPDRIFVEVTSDGDRFPDDVTFVASGNSRLICEKAISTSDPKVKVVLIRITSPPAKGHSFPAEIEVWPSRSGPKASTFTFNILHP